MTANFTKREFLKLAGLGGVVFASALPGFGSASRFVNVPIDSASITFSNQTSFVLDAGRMAFPLGQNSTVVVGPAAPGATVPLRFFTVQGC